MKHLRLISHLLNPTRTHISKLKILSLSHSTPINQSWSHTSIAHESTSTQQQEPQSKTPTPTQTVSDIVEQIANLNLIEVSDLTELLRHKLGIKEMPHMAVMMPGMSFTGKAGAGKGGGGGGKVEEEKKEKTAFDLKLEGFDAASKIKIIKEVRTFTDLGLKEAKDLVEKAPTLLKKGVLKEEAEKIILKMKEIGAKVVME